jgi:hypothetical protein
MHRDGYAESTGYGAVFVGVGVVTPSEYTYRHPDRNSLGKAGEGLRLDGVDTSNNEGVCGGSFHKSKVQANGTMDKDNREVVYWFDKLPYICVLGICIVKR